VTAGREIAAATGPVGYALAQATRAHRNEMQHRMTQLGLHLGQELLIIDIHQHPDTTQAELVRRIGMEQPTIAKATTRMQRTGFVERIPDPHDRRVIRLRLTERGQAVVEAILAAWADVEATATNGLTQPEAEQLTRLLHKIHDNLA
jgi:DNA-binding MarR family transcriptional regulator